MEPRQGFDDPHRAVRPSGAPPISEARRMPDPDRVRTE